jgi:hypothetical protein
LNPLLQTLLPFLKSDTVYPIDLTLLKRLQLVLFKGSQMNPDGLLTGDESLVSDLCQLHVELQQMPSPTLGPELKTLQAALSQSLNAALKPHQSFKHSSELQNQLHDFLSAMLKHSQSNFSRFKGIVLTLLTLSPIVGFFMLQSLILSNNGAVLDELSFVFPDDIYTENEGGYRFDMQQEDRWLGEFRQFYFAETLGWHAKELPLPLTYGVDVPALLQSKLNGGDAILQRLDAEDLYPVQGEIQNLVVFRALLRNVKEHDILTSVSVRASLKKADTFPWRSMDISASIDTNFSILEDSRDYVLSSMISVNHSPVTQLTSHFALHGANDANDAEVAKAQLDIGYLTHHDVVVPIFDRSVLYNWSPDWLMFNLNESAHTQIEQDRYVSPQQLVDQLRRHQPAGDILGAAGYVALTCPDNSIVVLSTLQHIGNFAQVSTVDNLLIDHNYQLLDGTPLHQQFQFDINHRLLITDLPATNFSLDLLDCVGDEVMRLTGHPIKLEKRVEAVMANVVEDVARFLLDKPVSLPPVIVAVKTFVLDFSELDDQTEVENPTAIQLYRRSDDLVVLKDGDYVLVNVIATGFEGGIYDFQFYFDDKVVGQIAIDLVWPQSFQFETGDEQYFRKNVTENNGSQTP